MTNFQTRVLFSIAVFLYGCKEEIVQDERLLPFAESVQFEMAQRGLDFELDMHLKIVEGLVRDHGANGRSQGNSIKIDEALFVRLHETNPLNIEALVAHELGHNVWGLPDLYHRHKLDSANRPIIMRSGNWVYITPETRNLMYDQLADAIKL